MQFEYHTNRLSLYVLGSETAQMVLDFYQKNKEIFEPWEPSQDNSFYTFDYQAANLDAEMKMFLNLHSIRYYIFLKSVPERIIGTVSFTHILRNPSNSCQIGYRMDSEYQCKGYASETLSFLIPIIMRELRISRIEANVMESNTASIRLLNRLSFTYEGIARGCYEIQNVRTDHMRFSLLATDIFQYFTT